MTSLESIVHDYCDSLPGAVAAYLFGSQAKGTATQTSDVDVAILFSPNAVPDTMQVLDLQEDLAGRLQVSHVDLVIMNRANPILKYQIYRYGTCVLEKNTKQMRSFRVQSLTEYADVKRMRAPIEQAILKGRTRG
jgi:predicted nucleotidyltransferase